MQSPSWEADSGLEVQEISYILWNCKVQYYLCKIIKQWAIWNHSNRETIKYSWHIDSIEVNLPGS